MKTVTLIAVTLAAAAGALAGEADVIPSVGLVHVDENDVDTHYHYLAAVPVFRYYEGGLRTETPLLTDVDGDVLAADDGLSASRLVTIGAPREESVDAAREAFGVAAADVVAVDGDVPAVAAALATNWAQARNVVVAPYAPSAGGTLAASTSYAAALASAINAPLLFTYTKRLPSETLSSLRRLGAKNVHLVDFGGRCEASVRAQLGGEGRNLGRTFERPDEVSSFVEKHLRGSRAKTLPLSA